MTSHTNHSRTYDVPSTDSPTGPSGKAAFLVEPSADLLDRARIGWERFLDSTSEVADE
ncbi:hypothetical protein [Streptomyces sp. NPDC127112]|uniref:hypothetical protein n=1 Tax=Streptomyces sp. NPDC127112 TaxID=3345364 RepID=UPI00363F8585